MRYGACAGKLFSLQYQTSAFQKIIPAKFAKTCFADVRNKSSPVSISEKEMFRGSKFWNLHHRQAEMDDIDSSAFLQIRIIRNIGIPLDQIPDDPYIFADRMAPAFGCQPPKVFIEF